MMSVSYTHTTSLSLLVSMYIYGLFIVMESQGSLGRSLSVLAIAVENELPHDDNVLCKLKRTAQNKRGRKSTQKEKEGLVCIAEEPSADEHG
jgi:hypothetical protein